MNESHPKFDLHMELLCSLPAYPGFAALADIQEDLKLKRQDDVQSLVKGLVERGFHVVTGNRTLNPEAPKEHRFGKRAAWINPKGKRQAIEASQEYWSTVNG